MAAPVHPYSDYGVAVRTLQSARGWLGYLLVMCVITQFVGFGLMYGTQQPYESLRAKYKTNADVVSKAFTDMLSDMGLQPPAATQRTEEWFPRTIQGRSLNIRLQWEATYTMAVPVTQVLGLVAATAQAIIIFLTLLVILVAQAPGVAQVTRSLIWAVLLAFMVFPWQFVFTEGFPIPGIFWGYHEMLSAIGPHVVGEHVYGYQRFLVLTRFLGWPTLAMLVLLITSERFRAGLMLAIGHPLQSIMRAPAAGTTPATRTPSIPVSGQTGARGIAPGGSSGGRQ